MLEIKPYQKRWALLMGSLANGTWQRKGLKAEDMLIETSQTENQREKKKDKKK